MAKRSAKCPQCGNRVELDAQAGEHIVCPQCQAHLTVNIHKTAGQDTPATPADPLIGQTLGEFEIVDLLGRGGMGAVYKARQPSLGRMVAVKVLSKDHSRDAAYVGRFDREARAAAAVNHTNIIQIYSVGADRGHQYIAMELVEGETLGDVLRRDGPVPPDRAVEIMKQVAAALAEAHAAGIVHRDIKPSNILLTPRGGVKVADFGLAKRPHVDVAVTQAGKILGTPLYMPPEVLGGREFEPRSDLYSLGATFYHVLAGRPPFEGGTSSEIAVKQVREEVPPLGEIAPDVPQVLARLIHRLLSKAPADRPATAAAVLEALKYIDADMAAARSPSGLGTALPPDQRRVLRKIPTAKKAERPKLLIPGIIAAAVLAAGIGILLVFALGGDGQGPKEAKPPSVAKPVVVNPQPHPPAWQAAWEAAKVKADALAKDEKFGPALAVYEALGVEYDDAELGEKIQQSGSLLHDQAAAAWRRVRDRAQSLSDQKKFDEASAALRPALEVFGVAEHTQQARTMLAQIAAAQAAAKPTTRPVVVKPTPPRPATRPVAVKPTPKTQPAPATQPKPSPADDLRRRREAQYAEALRPVEALVAAWDFAGAEAALAKLNFEYNELAQRLATRRDEVQRLAKLKAKIVAQVNKTKPWLRKGQAVVPGSGGKKFRDVGEQIASADEKGVTLRDVKAVGEKTRRVTWAGLDDAVLGKFLALTVSTKNGDDQLAAGLLALARKDTATAEKHFEKARTLGVKIDRYLDPLAAAAFANANALLEAKKYTEAGKELAGLEKKYTKTPWFASHRDELDVVRARVTSAIADAEAQKLYAHAVKLFGKKDLWGLKPLVEKLKTDYAKTPVVTDAARKPTFGEMAKATAKLGTFLTVRRDGRGDFRTIQAALDSAPPYSLIEVQDEGPHQGVEAPRDYLRIGKKGIVLRGAKGIWPVVRPPPRNSWHTLAITGEGSVVERMVLIASSWASTRALYVRASCRLRNVILQREDDREGMALHLEARKARCELETCIVLGGITASGTLVAGDSLWLAGGPVRTDVAVTFVNSVLPSLPAHCPCELRSCTIPGFVTLSGQPNLLRDCIVGAVRSTGKGTRIEYSNILRKEATEGAEVGKGCFSAAPQFRDPKNFDYRLKPTSPCRKKASDGGDVGCRYTPEMIEILKKALELRKKGIIKF